MFITFMMPATRNRMPIRILPTRRTVPVLPPVAALLTAEFMVPPPLPFAGLSMLCRKLSCVDQHKRDTAATLAAVHPGVVGSLLHQHIARSQMHLALVEDHVDLAFDDDRVVDAARLVH